MTSQRIDHAERPAGLRRPLPPATRAFAGGLVLGLAIGALLGALLADRLKAGPKWTPSAAAFVRLPEQTALGPLPQTILLPASSYDFGGVGQPLNQAAVEAGSIVKVELQAQSGQVGVGLARPDGGELVSREAVVNPQQGKTVLYFRTAPGMGPVILLLRAADNAPAGAAAVVDKVETAPQAELGPRQMQAIAKAGLY